MTTPNVSVDPLAPPIIEPYDLYTLSVMPSLEKPNTLPPLDAETSTAFGAAASGMDSIAQQSVALVALADSELATFLVASDHFAVNGAAAASVAAYYTSPRVIMFEGGVSSGSSSNLTFGFDLVHDSISAIAYPGQVQYATISFNMARGHVDSALESVAFPAVPGVTFMSAYGIIQSAVAAGIPLVTINSANAAVVSSLNISAEAKARITVSVEDGLTVFVPAASVTVNGAAHDSVVAA